MTFHSDNSVSQDALEQMFTSARTHHSWTEKPVTEAKLKELYDLMKWAPTCVNGTPARIVFVKTSEMKEKLISCLMPKNMEKTRKAPVTAIIAYDLKWYDQLVKLSPHTDYRPMYAGNPSLSETTAFRNSSIQGGYFMMAARALGLDVGPMSGFDIEKVNEIFFKDSAWRANFLCNLGYGDGDNLHPRAPRLEFAEATLFV